MTALYANDGSLHAIYSTPSDKKLRVLYQTKCARGEGAKIYFGLKGWDRKLPAGIF